MCEQTHQFSFSATLTGGNPNSTGGRKYRKQKPSIILMAQRACKLRERGIKSPQQQLCSGHLVTIQEPYQTLDSETCIHIYRCHVTIWSANRFCRNCSPKSQELSSFVSALNKRTRATSYCA